MSIGFLSVFLLTSFSCLLLLGVILYLILKPEGLDRQEDNIPSRHQVGESVPTKRLPTVKNA
ncbi:MAG: hypothetical protein M1297_00985 [Nitrospirae bacterium]|nr:hypothetical protein [Nitrospirota bacterium]